MEAATYLTTQDAAAALGVTERTIRRMIDAGQLPGAVRISGPRSPWRVPAAALTHTSPAPRGPGAGLVTQPQEPAMRPRYDTPRTPATITPRHLVSTAVSAAHLLAHVSTTRPARACSALVLDVVAAASRHQPDRDARCQHCGWTWPCPDAVDLTAALDSALSTLTDGGAS
jgi:excisionase family DNA binding protein